ncbi:MAG: hypothetical protein WCF81_01770, partial [Roseiarcus sp.]
MLRLDAPDGVKTVDAFSGLRDALCVSAIVAQHALTLKWRDRQHRYSDAFAVYPWFPHPHPLFHGLVRVVTPALASVQNLTHLQPQCAPALSSDRSFVAREIDRPLLDAILARWKDCFATGNATNRDRRLFRALEMARAASRMPGGTDATFHDEGRAVALWVSAFEILARDEGRGDGLGRVRQLLSRVQLQSPKLRADSSVVNTIYKRLWIARNEFLHGSPVTAERLKLEKCKKPVGTVGNLVRGAG